jgi:hypothetical protein
MIGGEDEPLSKTLYGMWAEPADYPIGSWKAGFTSGEATI